MENKMDNLANIDIDNIDLTNYDQLTLEFWAARYWTIENNLRTAGFDDLADIAHDKAGKFWNASNAKSGMFK